MKHSTFLNLNWQDFFKGLIMAVGTPVLYLLQELIPHWNLSPIEKAAISASVTYLLKNFFTPTPKTVQIDPSKTSVVDSKTKEPIINAN
jgi:hypothetical protein